MSLFPKANWKFKDLFRSANQDTQGQIQIVSKQIYILPTRFGLMYGTLVLAMLSGSINYANNLGYLLTFFLAGIGVITILQTWKNLLHLTIFIDPVKPVFQDQSFSLKLRIKNNNDHPRGAIHIGLNKKSLNTIIHEIPAQSTSSFSLPLNAKQRGWYKVNRLVLSTQYPLGLLRAWVYLNVSINVLIYPKPSDHWKVPQTAIYSLSSQGDKGVGADDFVAHRNYRQTDSPRQIDWKVFAREKGLMSKQFGGDRNERLWLSFDLLPDLSDEKILSALTRAVLDSEAADIEYGLKIPGQVIAINHGYEHKNLCLKALATFNRGVK